MVRAALLFVLLIPALFASPWFIAYSAPLPDVSNLDNGLPGDTIIFAGDGTSVLADLHTPGYQHYDESLSAMGPTLPEAVVAIEDKNFYNEPGIDPAGIARAAFIDLREHNTQQGASTITQQLVKVRLLGNQPTFQRKLTEALLAFAVERHYTKSQILEMYLNSVSFGNSATGTAAASSIYFHKKTSELDLAQASILAGMVRGPTLYNPFTNWTVTKARQHEVLSAMVDAGDISQSNADKAFKEDVSPPNHMYPPMNRVVAPGFVSYVTSELKQTYGSQTLYSGSLRIYTTLSIPLQNIAQASISGTQRDLAWRNVQQGALVALDPTSGAILAMVGSANPGGSGGQYNLAVWPPRNPGSSMKIYTYSAAIASGKFTMTTPIRDSPITVRIPGQPDYRPMNYDGSFHGTCQVQVCIGNSLNVPAVKVEIGTGIPNVVDMARAMGAPPWQQNPDGSYSNNDDPNSFGPSLTLGGYGETPLQMATGASVLASRGVLHQPYAIFKVVSGGATVYEHQASNGQQVIDPRVAFIMSEMLSRDQNRALIFGRDSQLVIPGWNVAVKTGTSDSFADAWTVGYTPKLAVAVWMGNPDWRQKMTEGSDSYYVAVPAWHRFMAQALPIMGQADWGAPPAGLISAWGNYYLPGTQPSSQPGASSSGSGGGGQGQGGGHHKKGGG